MLGLKPLGLDDFKDAICLRAISTSSLLSLFISLEFFFTDTFLSTKHVPLSIFEYDGFEVWNNYWKLNMITSSISSIDEIIVRWRLLLQWILLFLRLWEAQAWKNLVFWSRILYQFYSALYFHLMSFCSNYSATSSSNFLMAIMFSLYWLCRWFSPVNVSFNSFLESLALLAFHLIRSLLHMESLD